MRVSIRKLALMAVLTAIALIVFIIEAQIQLPLPIPGTKLGLANTVTLFALFFVKRSDNTSISLGTVDAFMILICRLILGAVFSGRIIAFLYSLAGGLLAFLVQALLRRFVSEKQVWVCGVFGAIFHNLGQILMAAFIMGTLRVVAYLPLLIIAGVITGVITGLIAQFSLRIRGNGNNGNNI